MPKISVITVSYNSQDTIENTILSVQNQTYKDFEYILVDGNSKDKTLEIAGKYKDFIKKWISEPDRSKFDGMNKGVLLAQGEYIIFLDAGNTFASNETLEQFSKYFDGNDIVYGKISTKKLKNLSRFSLYKGNLNLSAEFIKTSFFETLGGFDTRFKFEADYEMNLRAIIDEKAKLKYVDEPVVLKNNSVHLEPKRVRRSVKEKMVIRKAYFSNLEKLFYNIFAIIF